MRDLVEPVATGMDHVLSSIGIDNLDPRSIIGDATDKSHGDLAVPFHRFSGVLKRSPVDIADEAAEILAPYLVGIANVSSKAGYVNFRASPGWVSSRLVEICRHPTLGVEKASQRTVVVDYSSPNIAKEMHVGHLRSTVIGDSLVRIFEAKGNRVIRENHVGDWGTPFGMLIERLEDLDSDGIDPLEALSDLGQFYRECRIKFDEDENFRQRARERVVSLQAGDGPTLQRWSQLVDISMGHFQEVYELLGVLLTRDDVMGESKYDPLLPGLVEQLHEKGILETNNGALVIYPGDWVNRDGDPLPLIIRKSDGGYNYATTDLACISDRTKRLNADDLIYVVGTEQKQHFEMVFASARKGGLIEDRHTATHVSFGLVLGPDGGKLKSRSGEAIRLLDLLNEAIERASVAVLERNPDISKEDLKILARSIGIGAVKYSDLKSDRTKDYIFDWDKMLSFEGETGPYIQYAHARINSILNKERHSQGGTEVTSFDLASEHEMKLAREVLKYPEAVDHALADLAPSRICKHLHKMSQAFGSFYENCPVLTENKEIRDQRIELCRITGRILEHGLNMLGMDAPSRM